MIPFGDIDLDDYTPNTVLMLIPYSQVLFEHYEAFINGELVWDDVLSHSLLVLERQLTKELPHMFVNYVPRKYFRLQLNSQREVICDLISCVRILQSRGTLAPAMIVSNRQIDKLSELN